MDATCVVCQALLPKIVDEKLCSECEDRIKTNVQDAVNARVEEEGFDSKLFATPPPKYFECPLCLCVLRNPVQLQACGHRYCASCLRKTVERDEEVNECPLDRLEIRQNSIFDDIATKRNILDSKVHCENTECDWTGELWNIEIHLLATCDYLTINCINEGCQATVERGSMVAHLTETCNFRTVACQFCDALITYDTLEDHYQSCEKFPVECKFNCGDVFSRGQIAQHYNECPARDLTCHYQYFGCDFQGSADVLEKHMESSVHSHLDLTVNRVSQLEGQCEVMINSNLRKEEETTKRLLLLEREVASLHEKNKVFERMESAVLKLIDRSKETKKVEDIVTELQKNETLNRLDDSITNLAFKYTEVEKATQTNAVECSKNAGELFTCVNKLEQFIERKKDTLKVMWPINNFAMRYKSAQKALDKSIESDIFYTSQSGYKFKLRAFLNGTSHGKKTHVSVLFVLMKGPFDALLSWPFARKVTISMISKNGADRSMSFDTSDHEAFKRPTANENDAWGWSQFIAHTEIAQYIHDDNLFIRCQVKPSVVQGQGEDSMSIRSSSSLRSIASRSPRQDEDALSTHSRH